MRSRSVLASVAVAVALSSALCAAGPKVDIRIIPRPRVEEEVPPVRIPIPSRDPLPAFQGPFVDTFESLPCIREEREMKEGKAYILDLCLLANVTIEAKIDEKVEVEVKMTEGIPDAPGTTESGDDDTAELEEPVSDEEEEEPEIPTILGIFRGWQIDPITLNYKYMVYDDGDECMDNDHYSMTVELIPSSNPESDTTLYGLKKTGMCTFKASLLTYVPEGDRLAGQGIHTPGVVDISDAESSLPVICGKMKCRYGDISKRVRDLSGQIRDVQDTMTEGAYKASTLFTNMTLETSKNTLESATQILEKSLELFHEIEDLQRSLTNDFLGREETAKKEIAEQEAEDRKREEEKNATQAAAPVGAHTVQEQDEAKKSHSSPGYGHAGTMALGDLYFQQFGGVEAKRAALSLRQESLQHELLRMRQQQLVEARKERREELRTQMQRLEQQVHHYELKTSNLLSVDPAHVNDNCGGTKGSSLSLEQRLSESSESTIERLLQQNQQIISLLRPQRNEDSSVLNASDGDLAYTPTIPIGTTKANPSPGAEEMKSSALAPQELHNEDKKRVTFHAPTALSWLPEFEWTDEDEKALDKLENEPDFLGNGNANMKNTSQDTDDSASTSTAKVNASKDQKARDRLESRKKLEALLSASFKNAGGGALRRPRWRLEAEAESDEVSRFDSEDSEAMEPLQIFRSVVLAIMFAVQLKTKLMSKKMAEKEAAMRDFEAVLRVYFDATRMWLGKVIRTPLLSLLQESLDVDISSRSGLAGSSLRGFAKKFGGILARRPPPGNINSNVDPAKLLKLKVRLIGILRALGKAIDKKEVPSGVLDFWKRISTDGVYFPPNYQLFDMERQSLEFDDLGATRRMDFVPDGTNLVDQDESGRSGELATCEGSGFSRFNVVMVNFLLVRILIPHVILQPWNVGIGPKNIGKQATASLTSLATLLYCVCRQLSPLPAPAEPPEASFLGRQWSIPVATAQPNTSDESSSQTHAPVDSALEPQEEKHTTEISFMSIDEIGRRLIPDKNFPTEDLQVAQVVKEQQTMLDETLKRLRAQLHASQEKL